MVEYYFGMNLYMDILEWVVVIVGGYFIYIGKIILGDFVVYILYVKMFI